MFSANAFFEKNRQRAADLQAAYADREDRKREAWIIYRDRESFTFAERCSAVVEVIRAHYERSLESWQLSKRRARHGTFYEYAQSWVWASNHVGLDADVMAWLSSSFPTPKKPRIAVGRSYWGTWPPRRKVH